MEKPNVNNLNGVPNFGYGFPEETPVTIPSVEEHENEDTDEDSINPTEPVQGAPDGEVEVTNQETNG